MREACDVDKRILVAYLIGDALHEVWSYLTRDRRTAEGPTVAAFWRTDGVMSEEALGRERKVGRAA